VEKISREKHHFTIETKNTSVSGLIEVWEKSEKLSVELFKLVRPIIDQYLKNEPNNPAGGQ